MFNHIGYGVTQVGNQIIMQDLRMGLEPNDYVFQYFIGREMDSTIQPVPNEQYRVARNDTKRRLQNIWGRIWGKSVEIHE